MPCQFSQDHAQLLITHVPKDAGPIPPSFPPADALQPQAGFRWGPQQGGRPVLPHPRAAAPPPRRPGPSDGHGRCGRHRRPHTHSLPAQPGCPAAGCCQPPPPAAEPPGAASPPRLPLTLPLSSNPWRCFPGSRAAVVSCGISERCSTACGTQRPLPRAADAERMRAGAAPLTYGKN